MIFPPGVDPSRGVAYTGVFRRWSNKVIPYDISAITSKNKVCFDNIDVFF